MVHKTLPEIRLEFRDDRGYVVIRTRKSVRKLPREKIPWKRWLGKGYRVEAEQFELPLFPGGMQS